ncbi:MAG: hypothetical protein H6745_10110 [Deltaproteobacteria bacterium]|nr:hypothetical protein [Deltaproteobacteria bacterium]
MTIRTNLPAQRRPLLGRDADLACSVSASRRARASSRSRAAPAWSSSLARALGLAEAGDPAARWRGGVVAVDVPASGALVDAVATALGVTLQARARASARPGSAPTSASSARPSSSSTTSSAICTGRARSCRPGSISRPSSPWSRCPARPSGSPTRCVTSSGPPSGGDDPREVGAAEALFTIRAEAVSPGCSAALGFAEAARALVRQLDRNPLAIEVAAARMTVMTPASLLRRLDERLRLLRAAPIGAGRGLWDSLAESWEALTEREQRALMRLAALRAPAPSRRSSTSRTTATATPSR